MSEFIDADLRESIFREVSLRRSRFTSSALSDVVMRGVEVGGMEIDSPWLIESGDPLLVNGIDVVPFVDAELNKRFPGRELRTAATPDGLREAWEALQRSWIRTVRRAEQMPAGSVDVSIDGEWSFAQTLRHLVMATDIWLGRAILGRDEYHPIGVPNVEYEADGGDVSVFSARDPSFEEVLAVRADRVAQVGDYLANLTEDELNRKRRNPWAPEHEETVLSCLHTILEEEWEHHRYAVRDLDAIEARS